MFEWKYRCGLIGYGEECLLIFEVSSEEEVEDRFERWNANKANKRAVRVETFRICREVTG